MIGDKSVDLSPIRLDLLDDQETEFQELFENIDGLSDKQAVSVLEKLDRIREKIKGKQPMQSLNADADESSKEGLGATGASQLKPNNVEAGSSSLNYSDKITKRVSDQVNSGLIPADRVEDSELHSLVVESNTATKNGQNNQKEAEAELVPKAIASTSEAVPKEQEWYTVTRRRAQMQKSSIVVGNKGSEGGGPGPSNG
ncbi:hypothetical protein RIF29_33888 [Crotalaria pallida]|uniref:Uncharacterized protein n=1 Tax=Crotalaria pallida TaxID=3830 RepID=A0AAN9EE78_CROPI